MGDLEPDLPFPIPIIISDEGVYPPSDDGWARLVERLPWQIARAEGSIASNLLRYLNPLPVLRELVWRNYQDTDPRRMYDGFGRSIRSIEAARMQISGVLADNPCGSCARGNGMFSRCVVIVGCNGLKHCANCHLSGHSRHCVFPKLGVDPGGRSSSNSPPSANRAGPSPPLNTSHPMTPSPRNRVALHPLPARPSLSPLLQGSRGSSNSSSNSSSPGPSPLVPSPRPSVNFSWNSSRSTPSPLVPVPRASVNSSRSSSTSSSCPLVPVPRASVNSSSNSSSHYPRAGSSVSGRYRPRCAPTDRGSKHGSPDEAHVSDSAGIQDNMRGQGSLPPRPPSSTTAANTTAQRMSPSLPPRPVQHGSPLGNEENLSDNRSNDDVPRPPPHGLQSNQNVERHRPPFPYSHLTPLSEMQRRVTQVETRLHGMGSAHINLHEGVDIPLLNERMALNQELALLRTLLRQRSQGQQRS
ncbi:hypothetical protein N7509_001322 [Penicillium cosmopolitanum]|uniref:Uncharacterized protein n=1 Tax=Penicillium cosmopolitanum TaxID=1131564 RepID=A0A9X0BF01_9EURO|nr:uncharacterized protein N7509_001322 [Penicillium cosmopolitanum]KAJ5414695.1 hypothetical protein N7509_001322 [Penicillium cosmopolitanum]